MGKLLIINYFTRKPKTHALANTKIVATKAQKIDVLIL